MVEEKNTTVDHFAQIQAAAKEANSSTVESNPNVGPKKAFVYGTLRAGCSNRVIVGDLVSDEKRGTIKGFRMFHYGSKHVSFPFLEKSVNPESVI